MLPLRCAASLQCPSLTIAVTSPIILYTVGMSGLTQQTKVVDYQSAGVSSVAASHSGSLSATGSVAHEGCSQGVLGKHGSAFQMGQGVQRLLQLRGSAGKPILRPNEST